jgi:hypothetical protein
LLGSFEEWDRVVRGAVWYATGNDCLTNQRKAEDESPERLEKLALLEGWAELQRDEAPNGLTVDEALEFVREKPAFYALLQGAFVRMTKDGKLPSVKVVGNRLRCLNRQNVGGLRFVKVGTRNHSSVWTVVR